MAAWSLEAGGGGLEPGGSGLGAAAWRLGATAGGTGLDYMGEVLGAGQEDWVGRMLDNQVFGWQEIGGG